LLICYGRFAFLGIEHVSIAPGITRMIPLDFTDYVAPFAAVSQIGHVFIEDQDRLN